MKHLSVFLFNILNILREKTYLQLKAPLQNPFKYVWCQNLLQIFNQVLKIVTLVIS